MSTPATGGPSVPEDTEKGKGKKGIERMLSRVKTVLKKGESSKRFSLSEGTKRFSFAEGSKRFSFLGSSKAKKGDAAQDDTKAETKREGVTQVSRTKMFEERARHLGERFGLEIKPSEWHSIEGNALRMEKPIRMRVRRTCHKCQATFGALRECPCCQHVRCSKCLRQPPRRSDAEKQASREKRAALLKTKQDSPPIAVDWRHEIGPTVLTIPRKTGGADLVYKKPRQRVRRTCHECKTLFTSGSRNCQKCGHVRCTDCPRDPPKKEKYPFGYPGDVFGPNAVPHHECHQCGKMYPGDTTDGTACVRCTHQKCEKCPRLKPRKVEPDPDPDILKSIEKKMSKLGVD